MNIKPFISTVVLLLMCSFALAQDAIPDNDFQVWNETTLAIPLIKEKDSKGKEVDKLTALLIGNLRFGQNRLAFVDERIGGGFEIRLNNNFQFSPTYIYVASQPGRFRREFEHRVRFDLSYEKKWKRFSIKDRNRVEYRIRNARDDSVRYRNRIQLKVPVIKDDKEIFAPFIGNEVYYDFTAKQWTRNDFSVGIAKKINNNMSTEYFYGWRHNYIGLPRNVNVVGVNLRFRID